MEWVKETWAEERPPRLGILFHDAASGWSTLESLPEWCADNGIEFVGYEVIPMLCLDATTELLRLAGKNPDWIFCTTGGVPLTAAVRGAAQLDLQKQGINFAAYCGMADKELFYIV